MIGIICEYNPFHNGHLYQIEQIKKQYSNSKIVAVMSGNFSQRSQVSVISKWAKVKTALLNGVDMVLEIPVSWATRSAHDFAYAGVLIAEKSGIIDRICFSSECGDIDSLRSLADLLDNEQNLLNVKKFLSIGENYPKSVQKAVDEHSPELGEILKYPNNMLAVEYLRALKKINSKIEPFTIKRVGTMHDENIANGKFAGASLIRKYIFSGRLDDVYKYVPEKSYEVIKSEVHLGHIPVSENLPDRLTINKLRSMTPGELSEIYGMSEGIENRIYKEALSGASLKSILEKVKTKRYSYAKIRRLVLHSVLNLKKEQASIPVSFIRVLGFRNAGQDILKELVKYSSLPVITNVKRDVEKPRELVKISFDFEANSTDFYALCTKKIQPYGLEYTTPLVKV